MGSFSMMDLLAEVHMMVEASESFDKERLVRAHELSCKRAEQVRQASSKEHLRVIRTSAVEETSAPSVPLRGLRPILISQLQLGLHHAGRVLHGTLCVTAVTLVAVHTVVADQAGQAAKLCIYNALPSTASFHKARSLFPNGLQVAIKEPYLKRAKDGCIMIRVENPANLERIPTPHDGTSASLGSSSRSSSPCKHQQEVLIHARGLRSQGNQAFAAQNWKQAISLYSNALQFILQSKLASPSPASPSSSSSSSSPAAAAALEVTQELTLIYSNRAEARLRLNHFEKAELDTRKALKLQPGHVKSLSRRGRALHGLHLYMEAVICSKKALKAANDGSKENIISKELTEAIRASEICEKQAATGESYDLAYMCKEVREGREVVCGEYIGPVAIGLARDSALGRGLLVTRDVKCGELLLVSKAVADAVGEDPFQTMDIREVVVDDADTGNYSRRFTSAYQEDLAIQLLDLAMASNRFRNQVYSLASNSSLEATDVAEYIPPMALFLPSKSIDMAGEEDESSCQVSIDVDRIRGVVRTNAFELPFILRATMWLLPSFINHSCTPNACWMRLGKDFLFVRAARHLTKGEEITIAYMDNAAMPYHVRADFCKVFRGFQCECERCTFERSVQTFTKPLQQVISLPSQMLDISAAAAAMESLEWVMQHCVSVFKLEKQKQWLRTSFASPILHALALHTTASAEESILDEQVLHSLAETILEGVQATLGGSELVIVRMRQAALKSPRLERVLSSMHLCLYGKQLPAALEKLLAIRQLQEGQSESQNGFFARLDKYRQLKM